eukprot:CAMPEP_0113306420 /NCGR_PEP_ID=MMETSP0010_2-20120614/5677_1 /TAXON_ID=216773 ORGANISM="Corethron hystrix, Strain 308" /NCGR_SAMPLE_ID=MMETSP0010_2 /ASSEMBLY_ACC=CAM_ASM_000155 /LENGTH=290 /DNA_ID=CAMNT_0000161081 /DNA_START=349 /DNA_END=1217 /DNA_ORIENTATION=+ /assembly_acc=CAM_ASM_000155
MSDITDLLGKLSIADAAEAASASLIESVKTKGPVKSGLSENYLTLAASCSDSTTAAVALKTVSGLAALGVSAEPYLKACLPAVLAAASTKDRVVSAEGKNAAGSIAEHVAPFAMKGLLPAIFAALTVETNWATRVVALKMIATFGKKCPKQLSNALPEVVPEITACMWDTKKQVKTAATASMKEALEVVGNKDIAHMTESILKAITTPKEVPEIMHKMAGVTFVQSVQSPALAMVVPLLLRGLREKVTATKRQSSVIINNMSKLVDDPLDAAPFLPLLLPALQQNADSIS